ncbi:MAG TPA: hypothetical protein VNU64_12840 [Burkholderiales bacterium]|nr:hypothetical protein [Burkholderiales bacterium]
MKYAIEADAEFLRVTVSGRKDDEPPSHVCKVVLMESERLQRPRILVELDQEVPLSPVSQYQLVSRLPELGLTDAHRIALVHRTAEMQRANEFINTVAWNRALNVRSFPDADAAKIWLRAA